MKRESNVEVSTQGINERANEDIPKGGNSMDPERIKKISESHGSQRLQCYYSMSWSFSRLRAGTWETKNQELQEDRQCLEAENQAPKRWYLVLLKREPAIAKASQRSRMGVGMGIWFWARCWFLFYHDYCDYNGLRAYARCYVSDVEVALYCSDLLLKMNGFAYVLVV